MSLNVVCTLHFQPIYLVTKFQVEMFDNLWKRSEILSKGSFQPRDGTQVSYIAGRFFTSWATREALFMQRWAQ